MIIEIPSKYFMIQKAIDSYVFYLDLPTFLYFLKEQNLQPFEEYGVWTIKVISSKTGNIKFFALEGYNCLNNPVYKHNDKHCDYRIVVEIHK